MPCGLPRRSCRGAEPGDAPGVPPPRRAAALLPELPRPPVPELAEAKLLPSDMGALPMDTGAAANAAADARSAEPGRGDASRISASAGVPGLAPPPRPPLAPASAGGHPSDRRRRPSGVAAAAPRPPGLPSSPQPLLRVRRASTTTSASDAQLSESLALAASSAAVESAKACDSSRGGARRRLRRRSGGATAASAAARAAAHRRSSSDGSSSRPTSGRDAIAPISASDRPAAAHLRADAA